MSGRAYVGIVMLLSLTTGTGVAAARAPWVKQAKDAGFPAQNCLYCHASELPKKETFKPDELNERGRWLLAEKEKRQVKDVDLSWLKDYPGGTAQAQ